jgi:multimeric flavodoxin WrbA
MNIVAIYGSERKGSTYHIVQMFLERLRSEEDSLTEFFLPRDMPHFCVGCSNCFAKGEAHCPHHQAVAPIQEAMRKADLIIFSSPVYVLRVSGQMKTLLDHFAFQFMIHRPPEEMFSKTALVVTTAAGGGMRGVFKDIKPSLDMWGIGRVFFYGKAVFAADWHGVSDKKKAGIAKSVDRIAGRIKAPAGKIRPRLKVRLLFHVFRAVHRKAEFSAIDKAHWRDKGWLDKAKPW